MIREGRFFNKSEEKLDYILNFESERMVVYVDHKTGLKTAYKFESKPKASKVLNLLSSIYKEEQVAYEKQNGKLYRYDYDARKAYKSLIKDTVKKAFHDYYEHSKDVYYPDEVIDDFCDAKDKDILHCLFARQKRFARKAFFNKSIINYFVTVTFDESLGSEEQWQKRLLKWMANNAVRNGFKFLGAFERGDINGRLHFHCLASLPESFVSTLVKVNRFSQKDKKWKTLLESPYLRERFGINEFDLLTGSSDEDFKKVISYVSAYTIKQGGRLYISRGLSDKVFQYVNLKDAFYCGVEGVFKFQLVSDVVLGEDSQDVVKRLRLSKTVFKE